MNINDVVKLALKEIEEGQMFGDIPKMTTEDKANMMMGFLPSPIHILTINPATGFYAIYKDKQEKEFNVALIGWAYLKNGGILPLIYNHQQRCHYIAYAVDGFMRICHGDNIPDDDEDDDDEGKYKPT